MDLNSLFIFAKVVEATSFSEAARRMHMPLATVSRRLADLEDQLGVRLLERSTRRLRLTHIGSQVLEHAQRSSELCEAVNDIVSSHQSAVTGVLRLAAPACISDSMLTGLVCAFQASYPEVRVHILINDGYCDHIADGVDLLFKFGAMKDSSLVARKILSYRDRLVASPAYLAENTPPLLPKDLLHHQLLTFSRIKSDYTWHFVNTRNREEATLAFLPHLAMKDLAGLMPALLAGAGICCLPPATQPDLLDARRLVEVMPAWRFPTLDLSLVHLGNRHIARPVRLFKEFAAQMAPTFFSSSQSEGPP